MKWTSAALVVLAALVAAALGVMLAWNWWTYDRHVSKLDLSVSIEPGECEDPGQPVLLKLKNGSTLTIERLSIELVARRKGRSTDVSVIHPLQMDPIIAPGKTLTACAGNELSSESADEDARSLLWSATLQSVAFVD